MMAIILGLFLGMVVGFLAFHAEMYRQWVERKFEGGTK